MSGNGTASVVWSGLDPVKEYEWYVTISDGVKSTTGNTTSFTDETTGQHPSGLFGSAPSPPLKIPPGQAAPSCTDVDGDPLTYSIVAQGSAWYCLRMWTVT